MRTSTKKRQQEAHGGRGWARDQRPGDRVTGAKVVNLARGWGRGGERRHEGGRADSFLVGDTFDPAIQPAFHGTKLKTAAIVVFESDEIRYDEFDIISIPFFHGNNLSAPDIRVRRFGHDICRRRNVSDSVATLLPAGARRVSIKVCAPWQDDGA